MAAIPTTYDDLIWLMCRRYWRGVDIEGRSFDMRWIKAQIMAESEYRPHAVSPVGARGLMQLMPGTSKDVARELGIPDNPFDPYINIMMGIYYLRKMWNIFRRERDLERLRFAFAAYNAGAGNIIKAQMRADERGYPTDKWASIAKVLASVTGAANARQTTRYIAKIERYYTDLRMQEKKR
ncbi:MAG: transglycosylase SLT domain-containing protein [bacterium]|nr:transglycosylase SLT domain-containing protein [bacterium]